MVAASKGILAADESNATMTKRLAEYRRLGARFARWRAVIAIGEHCPSSHCIAANAHAPGRYAGLVRRPGSC
jgi:fructose-bisphosphate aldolase, class I